MRSSASPTSAKCARKWSCYLKYLRSLAKQDSQLRRAVIQGKLLALFHHLRLIKMTMLQLLPSNMLAHLILIISSRPRPKSCDPCPQYWLPDRLPTISSRFNQLLPALHRASSVFSHHPNPTTIQTEPKRQPNSSKGATLEPVQMTQKLHLDGSACVV